MNYTSEQEAFLNAYKVLGKSIPDIIKDGARANFKSFAWYVQNDLDFMPFHEVYYRVLHLFAFGQIKKLIISMPPQHGKSEGSSRKLPAFMLGLNPDLKIGIGSYSASVARDFNTDVQRIIDSQAYHELFPNTFLNRSNVVTMANMYKRNSDVIEMVGHKGYLRVVGRGGALTSKSIDVMMMDDVYKDYAEGNSPIIRQAAWKWYTTVVRTRLHNNSQELIVFTRWHDDDLIGRLERTETVIDVKSWSDLQNIPQGAWVRINFEAIKTGEPTELDPRKVGQALWENKHSIEKLKAQRSLDPVQFECLYQGNPGSAEGRLYQPFKTYVDPTEFGTLIRKGNYTDVADEGNDYLCSICYDIYKSENQIFNEKTKKFEPLLFALITDVIFTTDNSDKTILSVSQMLNRNGTAKAWIESNNGGSLFKKAVEKKTKALCEGFYQGGNKESRITTDASMVNQHIIMPHDWKDRFAPFYDHVTTFLRDFPANAHDDSADTLTGIYEKEIADGKTQTYGKKKGVRTYR